MALPGLQASYLITAACEALPRLTTSCNCSSAAAACLHGLLFCSCSCCCWPGSAEQQGALQGLNWMRRRWADGKAMVIADEMGLGKTATVISFLQCLKCAPQLAETQTLREWPLWEADAIAHSWLD